ncbi:hypothetical protein A8C56_03845 [Niabella ginsenosidivorans]|uniref:Uncharacterized protein n=1 Tax=Niabella ginsenosidivorans TaxID=1176587 RepID=A0A1A9HZI9_9BACT|nr:hypothetical protein [Niabella ginsenosidivorans]ANH80229.1 hypothetical protein A8C56_03845 [Niabella ginsenosidivorans]
MTNLFTVTLDILFAVQKQRGDDVFLWSFIRTFGWLESSFSLIIEILKPSVPPSRVGQLWRDTPLYSKADSSAPPESGRNSCPFGSGGDSGCPFCDRFWASKKDQKEKEDK